MSNDLVETTTLGNQEYRSFIQRKGGEAMQPNQGENQSATRRGVFCGNISVVFDEEDCSGFRVGSRAKVLQNGVEIKDVRKITVSISPEEVISVDVEILPRF